MTMHEFKVDEGQRQILLLALFVLRAKRPGWDVAIAAIEMQLGGQLPWPVESAGGPTMVDACEWSLAYLTNISTISPQALCAKLIDALTEAGHDRAALDKAASAGRRRKPWRPASGEKGAVPQ